MRTMQWNRLMRRAYPFFTAGLLLQAGGCGGVDFTQLATGLTNAIVNELITGLVFGSLNLVTF